MNEDLQDWNDNDIEEFYKYCQDCGQTIDWEGIAEDET
jgi:hypothetical protein